MTTKTEVLQACTVEGNTVKLPGIQLDRKLYTDVAKALEGIGGKWNKKAGGFVFAPGHDQKINEMLGRVQSGEKINFKKDFQYFPTPEHIAARMVALAGIKPGDKILEPSAGQGAIVDEIIKGSYSTNRIFMCELMEANVAVLKKKYEGNSRVFPINRAEDFLKVPIFHQFDKIIANPPFTKNQDIDHICHMDLMLAPGGRIVVAASIHWQNSTEKKCKWFASWLNDRDAKVYPVPAGEFKESGTMVPTCIIVIEKLN